MSVSIRILEILMILRSKFWKKGDLVILEGLLRRKIENGISDAKMLIRGYNFAKSCKQIFVFFHFFCSFKNPNLTL